ncbi:hypothetical protein PGB90_005822 [Kerria lacca]
MTKCPETWLRNFQSVDEEHCKQTCYRITLYALDSKIKVCAPNNAIFITRSTPICFGPICTCAPNLNTITEISEKTDQTEEDATKTDKQVQSKHKTETKTDRAESEHEVKSDDSIKKLTETQNEATIDSNTGSDNDLQKKNNMKIDSNAENNLGKGKENNLEEVKENNLEKGKENNLEKGKENNLEKGKEKENNLEKGKENNLEKEKEKENNLEKGKKKFEFIDDNLQNVLHFNKEGDELQLDQNKRKMSDKKIQANKSTPISGTASPDANQFEINM